MRSKLINPIWEPELDCSNDFAGTRRKVSQASRTEGTPGEPAMGSPGSQVCSLSATARPGSRPLQSRGIFCTILASSMPEIHFKRPWLLPDDGDASTRGFKSSAWDPTAVALGGAIGSDCSPGAGGCSGRMGLLAGPRMPAPAGWNCPASGASGQSRGFP